MKRRYSTYNTYNKNRRTQHRAAAIERGRRRMIRAAAVLVLLLTLTIPVSRLFSGGAAIVQADQNLGDICYKVIEIQQGDSLWSIAQENLGPGYSDVYDYIRDIRECNQLKTNDITSGSYLMIPYYETQNLDYASLK